MKINMRFFSQTLYIVACLLGFLAYEIHIYRSGLFNILNIIFILFIMFIIFIDRKKIVISKNISLFFIFYFLFATYHIAIAAYHGDYLSIFRYILFFILFYFVFLPSTQDLARVTYIYVGLAIVLVIISVCIELRLLSSVWPKIFNRNASLVFDPNYASVLIGLGAILCLQYIKTLRIKAIFFFLFIGSLLTFSKGGVAALILSCMVWSCMRYSFIKNLIYILIAYIFLTALIPMLINTDLFRFNQGLNSRNELWLFTIDLITNQQQYFGVGANNLAEILKKNGFTNSSTHNYFMDNLASFGILSLILNIFLILWVTIKGWVDRNKSFPAFCFLFISSNSMTISFGGISLLSFFYTLFIFTIIYNNTEA